mgnify:CR=1 FL=1
MRRPLLALFALHVAAALGSPATALARAIASQAAARSQSWAPGPSA